MQHGASKPSVSLSSAAGAQGGGDELAISAFGISCSTSARKLGAERPAGGWTMLAVSVRAGRRRVRGWQ